MAFWGEGNISGGWQGLMGRKKPWQSYVMSPAAKQSMISGTKSALGGIDWNWKDGIEALNELKQPEYPKLAASRSGGPRPRLPGYTQTNMGAYGGDLVEQQAAMAKARREEELQRRMKLMGGGY